VGGGLAASTAAWVGLVSKLTGKGVAVGTTTAADPPAQAVKPASRGVNKMAKSFEYFMRLLYK
jgi:hypothetical protein